MVIIRWNVVIPKIQSFFIWNHHNKIFKMLQKGGPILFTMHIHTYLVFFFILLSVISKASIDEIIATIDCCSYECICGIFIQILFFFFYFDAKVRVLHANQVDSTCLRLVFSVSALLLFFICVTIRLWVNNIEERYTPMMIMKSSQFFFFLFCASSLAWNFYRKFV